MGPIEHLRDGEQGDYRLKQSSITNIQFDNNTLKKINSSEAFQETLRLIAQGKMATAENTRPGKGEKLLELTREAVEFGNPAEFSLPGPASYNKPDILDPKLTSLQLEDMIEPAQSFIEKALNYHEDIQVKAEIKLEDNNIEFANSQGFSGSYSQSKLSILLMLRLIEGKNMLESFAYTSHTHLDNIDWQELADRVLHFLDRGRKNVTMSSGTYPVVFIPETAINLLFPVNACLNGNAVARGLSPWKNRLGEKLFHEDIEIFNDGTLDRGIGSCPFDREGIPTEKFPFFNKGTLENFILDLDTAHELNQKPRGTRGERGPEANNVIMAPGQKNIADLLSTIDEGVLIADTQGTWAGNPYGGQVSGNISLGFQIKDGKITGRIKDAMFSLNTFKALKEQIQALSKEQRWVENALLPYMIIDEVNISLKEGSG